MIHRIVFVYFTAQGIQLEGIGNIKEQYTNIHKSEFNTQNWNFSNNTIAAWSNSTRRLKTVCIGKKLFFFEEAWNMKEIKASLNSWLHAS
jgi:hypothetical protein